MSDTHASPATATSPLLDIRDIRHAFGDLAVLGGVSATLPTGGLAALLGPSGYGKTIRCSSSQGRRTPGSQALRGLAQFSPTPT